MRWAATAGKEVEVEVLKHEPLSPARAGAKASRSRESGSFADRSGPSRLARGRYKGRLGPKLHRVQLPTRTYHMGEEEMAAAFGYSALMVTSWRNIGFDRTDFGGGAPARVLGRWQQSLDHARVHGVPLLQGHGGRWRAAADAVRQGGARRRVPRRAGPARTCTLRLSSPR